jgi:arsenite oxidase small subunit
MRRRRFIAACAGCALYSPARALTARDVRRVLYSRARLTDERGVAVRASSVVQATNYIFHYPFLGTPCFLINLGRPTQQDVELSVQGAGKYHWPGGVGPQRSIVAYSAICTHRMSYPTRQITFISYRERSSASAAAHDKTIHCCSEHSEYDPAAGARVVNGPAPHPLQTILLEHDSRDDSLYAVGALGGDIYAAFFSKYEVKLELDYGPGRARQAVTSTSVVTELQTFCKQQVRC